MQTDNSSRRGPPAAARRHYQHLFCRPRGLEIYFCVPAPGRFGVRRRGGFDPEGSMRKVPLFLTGFSILAVYVVASGAVGMAPDGSIVDCLQRPFLDLSPLGAGVLAAGALSFIAGLLALSPPTGMGPSLSWSQLLQATFAVNALLLAGIAAALFLGRSGHHPAQTVGVLFVAGASEAALGAVLAVIHLFLKRPRPVFLPTLAVYFVSTVALGAAYLLGSGTLS